MPDRTVAGLALGDLRTAAAALVGVAVYTPLIELPSLSAILGVPIAVKCEQLQPVGAFKIRGAYTAITRLPAETRARGVVTSSSGNHGRAVAYAARLHGIRAVVVMPESAPAVKVDGVRREGAEVVFAGRTRSAEQTERMEALAREEGLIPIPPFDHPDVIAGQATCGLEILEQRPDVGTILVPVGGGGLLAGTAAAIRALRRTVRLVGVEPAGAPKLAAALRADRPVTLERTESLADGLLTRSVGQLTWPVFRPVVHEAIAVSEDEIAAAVRFLHREAGLRVEPSGAVATAALLAGRVRPEGPTVAVASGGNVDPDLFERLVSIS